MIDSGRVSKDGNGFLHFNILKKIVKIKEISRNCIKNYGGGFKKSCVKDGPPHFSYRNTIPNPNGHVSKISA